VGRSGGRRAGQLRALCRSLERLVALALVTTLAPLLIGKLADAFTAYEKKQISIAELNAHVSQALMECFTEVMKTQSDALAKTFATFGQVLINSKLVRIVWAIVVLSQLCVLLWLQIGISALVYVKGGAWPSAGATGDWAYETRKSLRLLMYQLAAA
jgi:hypothetical protein